MVETLALENQLVEAEFDNTSIECKRCSFKYLCLPEPKEISEIDLKILYSTIEQYRLAAKLKSKAENALNEAKATLIAYAKEQPEQKFKLDDMAIAMYSVAEKEITYTRKAYTGCRISDMRKEDASGE
jgi:hypothetical protein